MLAWKSENTCSEVMTQNTFNQKINTNEGRNYF